MDKNKNAIRAMRVFAFIFLLMMVGPLITDVIGKIRQSNSSEPQVVTKALKEEQWSVYGGWDPQLMFMGNMNLGSGTPLIVDQNETNLGGVVSKLKSVRFIKTLADGQQVYHLVGVDKETPFILINENEAILQMGKVGISYKRSTVKNIQLKIERLKKNEAKGKEESLLSEVKK